MQATLFLLLRLALLISLYAFLGLIGWELWHEWRGQRTARRAERQPALTLLQPPDGRSLLFQTPEVVIGRGQECDVVIPDPTLSARHARFSFHHQQWWLEDLHTTNGTFLNEQMITTPIVITNGDTILCGRVRLEVQIEDRV